MSSGIGGRELTEKYSLKNTRSSTDFFERGFIF